MKATTEAWSDVSSSRSVKVSAGRLKASTALIAKHALLICLSFIMAFPFLWMFIGSLKLPDEIFTGDILKLPHSWRWSNYVEAWNSAPFGRFFFNSIIISAFTVLGQLITCSMAAYAFACVDFKGKNVLFICFVATTMIPFESTMIPSYLVIKSLGLVNTHMAMILPALTSVFGIFLLRQFYMTIPRDLFDAAKIDGCSHGAILLRIVAPLSKTIAATLSLFAFIHSWNNYLWPLLVTNTAQMRTVQIGLRYMIDKEVGTQWPQLLAASTFVIMPIMLLFLFLQKYFVRGMINSGLK
ncbi:carbohydrate ABC transporter permease [Paenibacillus thalictri]|uniref:Carbohydrate ABC transporter permease n=1 Tax=Paenibacillus thalictri TaxID=2527873 RepID=A0A4Q9DJY1_9BACL|nr:carbohydrate ABC transporter permease [Paenibacillus thalictri]TBL71388.1 carbohydrate ABC transporter permease [Paenibacillus thalictri]